MSATLTVFSGANGNIFLYYFSMAKKKSTIVYKCSNCGYTQPAWLGRCPGCGEWNTLEECITDPNATAARLNADGTAVKVKPVPMARISPQEDERIFTGNQEFDRVLGGGATKRSAVLIAVNLESVNQLCSSRPLPECLVKEESSMFPARNQQAR